MRKSQKPSLQQRWLRYFIPVVLVAAWVAIGAIGGPTFGKISSVSTNDQAAFLPSSAESTKVNELQSEFKDQQTIPAIVVIESTEPIAPDELGNYQELKTQLAAVEGVQQPDNEQQPTIIGPIASDDQRAIELIVPISSSVEAEAVVTDLRQAVEGELPAGQTAYVTGPAGLQADLIEAFGGIDSILLFVALGVVFVILLIVYRSLLLPIIVLLNSIFALSGSILVIFYLAKAGLIELSGQSQGILSILVIGAATDYSLLLVARYREQLILVTSKWQAIKAALKGVIEPIGASAATVIVALLCLLFSELNSNQSLGPIAATGIAFAFLATMTFLPALLVLFGRNSFWPLKPKYDKAASKTDDVSKLWHKVGNLIKQHSRLVWTLSIVGLVIGASGLLQLKASGVPASDFILTKSEAVAGQKVIAEHFNSAAGTPLVVIAGEGSADAAVDKLESLNGVSQASVYSGASSRFAASQPKVVDGRVLINARLTTDEPTSDQAQQIVKDARAALDSVDSSALVGGRSAISLDTNLTATRDLTVIIPIVLAVILVILIIVLRSLLAPLILIGSVVLSYATALGVSAYVFNYIFGFPGADPSVPLFGFVFLVALGVDYNIFLMSRVREESAVMGTRAGLLHALGKTGGVITSAGIVLAATFAALGVIPILFLAQIAFIVAFGVLLDTILVRSLLVPALCYDIGRTIWWPSTLARQKNNGTKRS